jgi:E3 ubiquitin-protein ligase BRE1
VVLSSSPLFLLVKRGVLTIGRSFDAQRDATEQATDLQTRLSSRESDLSRLRSARDDLKAEASELRAKESDKAKALDELRILAEARKGRLEAYKSEVRRLRLGKAAEEEKPDEVEARIRLAEAAAAGGEEEEGAEEGEVEDDLVSDLQSRLKKAEALLLALRDQLHAYAEAGATNDSGNGSGAPSTGQLVESETRAREELAKAQTRLEKLERVLGPGGEVEVREMAERLREKEEEVRRAEAKVKSQEAVRSSSLLSLVPSRKERQLMITIAVERIGYQHALRRDRPSLDRLGKP